MNNGCSALTHSGSQVVDSLAVTSCIQESRPAVIGMLPPVRLYTMTFLIFSHSPSASASSTITLRGKDLPPRNCSSAVITAHAPTSTIRSCKDLAENPPNTTEWIAPIRAQACIATIPSIDIDI